MMFLSKNEKIIIKFLQNHPSKNCDIGCLLDHLGFFDEEKPNECDFDKLDICLGKLFEKEFICEFDDNDDYVTLTNKCRTYSEPDLLKIIGSGAAIIAAIFSAIGLLI